MNKALKCNAINGPSFGSSDSYYVIEIHSDANREQSYSKIAYGPDEPNRLINILAGTHNFWVKDIEVFAISS